MPEARSRLGRKLLFFSGLALFLGLLFLRTETAWEQACAFGRRTLPDLTGLSVGLGRCEIEPFSQTVGVHGVSVFEPGAEVPLFAAELAEVSLGIVRPFSSTLEVDSVRVLRPRVRMDLSAAKGAEGKRSGCPLDAADRVKVGRLEIRGGEAELLLPDGELSLAGVDLSWKTARGQPEFRLSASRGSFVRKSGPPLSLTRLDLEGRLSLDDQSLEILRGEVGVDEMSFSIAGKVDTLCDPQLSLQAQLFVPLATVAELLELREEAGGHLWVNVNVTGKPADPHVGYELVASQAKLGHYSPGDLRAHGRLYEKDLRLESLTFESGGGRVFAQGSLKLEGNLPLKLRLETEGASFAGILDRVGMPGAWVEFPATAKAFLSGTLLPSPNLAGDLDLKAGKFTLATRAYDAPTTEGVTLLEFPSGHAKTQVKILSDRVELKELSVATEGSRVKGDVTLFYDGQQGLLIKGQAEQLQLSDFGHLAQLPWKGAGEAQFEISGPYADVVVDASLSMRDFEFWKLSLGVLQGRVHYEGGTLSFPSASGQKGKSQYQGQGELKFPSAKEGRPVMLAKGDVQLVSGRVEDLVDMMSPLHSSIPLFRGVLTGGAKGTVKIDCPADALDGRIDLEITDARYYARKFGDGRLTLRFDEGEALVMEPFVLNGALGKTWVDGTFRFDGTLDYRFGGELSLAEAAGEKAAAAGAEATLTLKGTVEGDATTPLVNAYLTAPKVKLAGRDLGAMHLEGRIEGKDAQLFGKPFGDARFYLKSRLREPFPYEASLTLALPEIRPLLPAGAAAQGVSGAVSGHMRVSGKMFEPASTSASAQIDKLVITRGDFEGRNDAPIALSYEHGKLTLEPATFRGPNTELTLAGEVGETHLDVELKGALDLRLVESFVPSIERAGGRIDLAAAARGPLGDPSVFGTAELKDARLSVKDQPYSVRGVSGRIEFSERRILLQEFHGALNGGRVALRGDVRLEKLQLSQIEVGLQLDEVTGYAQGDLPLTASGELLLYGKPQALMLSGGVDIVKFRYDRPLDLDYLLSEAKKGRRKLGEDPSEWLSFDVTVRASGDVRIDNNLARAKLGGELKLTGSNLKPGIVGSVQSEQGASLIFRNNQFQVSQGLLEFRDRRSVDALFDLRAETQVREYLVRLHAFGRAAEPQVILTSEPELAEGDILSLLTLGVTSRDQASAAGTGAGLAAEALFAASGLDKQVQRFLPKNAVLRDMSFHLSTTYNDVTGNVEPTAQLESKFLTEQLKLQMTQPMVSGRGTRAQAEYQFDNRLSAQAQWDNENSEYSFGNLGFGLKLRWEVE